MRSTSAESFRVGFVLFVALLILVAGIVLLGSKVFTVGNFVTYRGRFENIGGLVEGAPVFLGGVKVGSVKQIAFTEDIDSRTVEVVLQVRKDAEFLQRIREDSVARIETQGLLLGDKEISITLGSSHARVVPPEGVLKCESPPDFPRIVKQGESLVVDVAELIQEGRSFLQKVNKGDGTISKLLNEPTLHDDLIKTLDRAQSLADRWDQTGEDLQRAAQHIDENASLLANKLGADGDAVTKQVSSTFRRAGGELEDAAKEIRGFFRELREGDGTLARLAREPEVYDELVKSLERIRAAAANLAETFEGLNRGEGTLGGLLHDRAVLTSLQDLLHGVQQSGLLQHVIESAERSGREKRIDQAVHKAAGAGGGTDVPR